MSTRTRRKKEDGVENVKAPPSRGKRATRTRQSLNIDEDDELPPATDAAAEPSDVDEEEEMTESSSTRRATRKAVKPVGRTSTRSKLADVSNQVHEEEKGRIEPDEDMPSAHVAETDGALEDKQDGRHHPSANSEAVSLHAAEQVDKEQSPVPAQAQPIAATAQDLAAAARRAALDHAAQEKERERELAGKARLVIHQLVLENFKSYKGREVIGPFHKSFSAIVGPNGSGKSNTIDALLFVFGYRATKMRQGKLSELIHNSGAGSNPAEADAEDDAGASEDEEDFRPKKATKGRDRRIHSSDAIQSCTVEVWFREIIDQEGRDAYSLVPGSELVVARTATVHNTSHYTINGRTSSFTEVTTLLKDRGIDLDHKRFLILQGEVESIAQMKPKSVTGHDEGLLEYLEDIIGTSHYKGQIDAALVQVEQLNEARQTQLNRVKLSEREKASLEERKKDADQYLRDQNDLAHHQSVLYQRFVWESNRNTAEYQAVVDEAKKTLQEEIASQADIKAEVDQHRHEYESLQKDTQEAQEATNDIVRQMSILEKAEVQLSERKKALAQKIKKSGKTVSDDKKRKTEAETTVKNSSEEAARLAAENDGLEEQLAAAELELEKVRDGLKDKTLVFSQQIEALEVEMQPWSAQLSEKRSDVELLQSERDLLLSKRQEEQRALGDLEQLLSSLRSERQEKLKTIDSLTGEKKQLVDDERASTALLQKLDDEHVNLKRANVSARQRVDEARASQAASKAQGGVLDSLNKLRDQGRLPGFHGRLGSLATIPDKYDVAISTACAGLDNLVAETIETGQKCIEHLRKHQLGRAQILCLDKISRRDMSPIDTPENAPRLFDLLAPADDKFLPAFYQLLTNTLVANDLDQGKRLAFGSGRRWRVVTLDGQLIDTSGTMSGGGARPQKGKMSSTLVNDSTHTPQMIAKCEAEYDKAQAGLVKHTELRSAAQEKLRAVQARLPEVDVALSKAHMDFEGLEKRLAASEGRLKTARSRPAHNAADEKQLALLNARLHEESGAEAKLAKQCDTVRERIQVLQDKILEVGGVRLRSQQSKVTDLKARIDHNIDRVTKAEVAVAKATKDLARLQAAIESNMRVAEESQEELNTVETQLKATLQDKQLIQESVERAQEILAEKSEELSSLKSSLSEREKAMTLFKKRQFDLEKHLAASTKALEESQRALRHWGAKIESLSWHDLDTDDEEGETSKTTESPQRAKREGLTQLDDEELESMDEDSVKVLKGRIAAIEERIASSQLDLSVLKEYERREREFMQRAADLDAVTLERDEAKRHAEDLRNSRLREFMAGFGIISMKLKEMYQMITLGGNAELELVDSLDPFSEGIIFSVMPPKKSWKNISNLSGGEKTLSSLALVFALHVYKPTPLYFMDEIDAALDFRNVSIVANYIRDRTKHAQFIIISLRNNMFELSSRLVGIYKVANQTRSIAIDNRELGQENDETQPQ